MKPLLVLISGFFSIFSIDIWVLEDFFLMNTLNMSPSSGHQIWPTSGWMTCCENHNRTETVSLVMFVRLGEGVRLGESQGLFVVPSIVPADIQQGTDFPLDIQPEGVDEAQLFRTVHVIEGQRSALIVQEESQPVGGT